MAFPACHSLFTFLTSLLTFDSPVHSRHGLLVSHFVSRTVSVSHTVALTQCQQLSHAQCRSHTVSLSHSVSNCLTHSVNPTQCRSYTVSVTVSRTVGLAQCRSHTPTQTHDNPCLFRQACVAPFLCFSCTAKTLPSSQAPGFLLFAPPLLSLLVGAAPLHLFTCFRSPFLLNGQHCTF
jgi:hypothetical protein